MSSFRLLGAPGKPGAHDEPSRRPVTNHGQLEQLRFWAKVFALISTVAVVVPLVFGLRLLPPLLLLFGLALGPLLWFTNLRTVERMHRETPMPTMPRFRTVLAFAMAVLVGCSVTLWFFNGDIEAARISEEPAGRAAEVQRFEQDREAQRRIAETPLPTVEQDSEVMRLQQQLDGLDKALIDARNQVLCELDGTCGTRREGKAAAYFEKLDFQHWLESRVVETTRQLESVKADRRLRIDQQIHEQQIARAQVDRISEKLAQPAPSRTEPPSWGTALLGVVREQRIPVSGVLFGAFGLFFAIDLLAFRRVVRSICRRPDDGLELSISETLRDRWEREDQNAPEAIPYDDYLKGDDDDSPAKGGE